ncbi:asparagine--tRNA ligase [Buchnera aphidicola (Hormaphis cornu)]|nr:asparagine--tRNA ligase [Buchnera aphidicola (Hormaphis cornu)]
MNLVSIQDIYQKKIKINTVVIIQGWIRSRRDSKLGFSFLNIYDGSSVFSLQVIVSSDVKNYYNEILKLTTGCSVIVIGTLIFSKGIKQIYEINADAIKVLGWVQEKSQYPISLKKHTFEYLREFAHLRPRTNIFGVVSRLRHHLAHTMHYFLHKSDFFWVPTPIITSLNAEGAGNMFKVSSSEISDQFKHYGKTLLHTKDFFKTESFLTVSGQLTLETYACALSKVYTFGPTFRAENSNTSRHLSEFWMLEVEQSFVNLEKIINFSESMLKFIFKAMLNKCLSEFEFLEQKLNTQLIDRMNQFITKGFIHIDYAEAVNILKKSSTSYKNTVDWGIDFTVEHERFLAEKYFMQPIVIKNYPKELKAFYMRLNKDEKTVAAMDVIVPIIGELVGGSQREERLSILDQRLIDFKLTIKDYWWYRDLRKYGTVPHSGFGLGFERLLCYITGLKNVRDVIPFPRTPNNANF